jgi:hypothetical protein
MSVPNVPGVTSFSASPVLYLAKANGKQQQLIFQASHQLLAGYQAKPVLGACNRYVERHSSQMSS